MVNQIKQKDHKWVVWSGTDADCAASEEKVGGLNHAHANTWATRYHTWLLIKLTPKGIVFSFLCFSFVFSCKLL
jgi:hypothetical protein